MRFAEAVEVVYERSSRHYQHLMMDALTNRAFGSGRWIELFLPHAEASLKDARRWTHEERLSLRRALRLDNSSFRRKVGLPDASKDELSLESLYLEFARSEGAERLLDRFGRPTHDEEMLLIEAQLSYELPSDFMDELDAALQNRQLEAAREIGVQLRGGNSYQEALEAWRRWL